MMIDTKNMVAMTEANQNFSKITRLVDEKGLAIILKNNKPKYILVDFAEYEAIQELKAKRASTIDHVTDQLIDENLEAFQVLAQ
ncbi:MAG: type II toxin-antitoxin system Phd/YefM family antitoxin [Akkermansia sp.]